MTEREAKWSKYVNVVLLTFLIVTGAIAIFKSCYQELSIQSDKGRTEGVVIDAEKYNYGTEWLVTYYFIYEGDTIYGNDIDDGELDNCMQFGNCTGRKVNIVFDRGNPENNRIDW